MCYTNKCPGENNKGECTLNRLFYCDLIVCYRCNKKMTVYKYYESHKNNCKDIIDI